jgi:arylsulfatase A-like enzyme
MQMADERPNVVFVMCDQLRGDALGCYGHPVVETPYLDQIAAQGVRFTRAYSAVPSCIAARAAVLTGMGQKNHGRVGYRDGVMFDYPYTLPGELAKNGYHTQCVGKMHVSPARNLCGFHNVVLHDGYLHHERKARKNYELADDYMVWLKDKKGQDADLIMHGLEANAWVARPWHYEEALHPTTWATTMAIDFLRRRDPSKPFFLMLSYVRPHPPLDPPKVYYDQYISQEFPDVPMGDWSPKDEVMKHSSGGRGFMGERQLHRARAAYYAQVTHIDHQMGRLIEYLREHEVYKNTFFIFTSDHGELLGDHNLFRKALPFEGSARIPFIVAPPDGWKCERGSSVALPVELQDVMPTILDACGVGIPDTVDGLSVLPLTRNELVEWRPYIHGEHSYGDHSNHFITNGKVKYIWFSRTGQEQFFDLEKDPFEEKDLITSSAMKEEVELCRNYLIKELEGREEGYSDGRKLVKGKSPVSVLKNVIPGH